MNEEPTCPLDQYLLQEAAEMQRERAERLAALKAEPLNVRFIQYLMPDGRKEEVFVKRSQEIADKARILWKYGYRLECEMLGDYQTISLTAEKDGLRAGDVVSVAHEIAPNGPKVHDAVDVLITKAYDHLEGKK